MDLDEPSARLVAAAEMEAVRHPRARLQHVVVELEPELEAATLLVELAPVGRLPGVDQVRAEVGDEDEIGLALAHHLVGDRGSAALRIVRFGLHGGSFTDDDGSHNSERATATV